MIKKKFEDLYDSEICADAIINDEYHGFKQDYLMLHLLLRKYKPKTVFEIGCNCGLGTLIIKNAVMDSEVYSLDLPHELAHISLQSPVSEGKGDRVGHLCKLPFTLIREDSMKYDFSKIPCEAYYVDGEHTFEAVNHETKQLLKLEPKIIIYHDTNMDCVLDGILNASEGNKNYDFYRITDTRIGYLLRKY